MNTPVIRRASRRPLLLIALVAALAASAAFAADRFLGSGAGAGEHDGVTITVEDVAVDEALLAIDVLASGAEDRGLRVVPARAPRLQAADGEYLASRGGGASTDNPRLMTWNFDPPEAAGELTLTIEALDFYDLPEADLNRIDGPWEVRIPFDGSRATANTLSAPEGEFALGASPVVITELLQAPAGLVVRGVIETGASDMGPLLVVDALLRSGASEPELPLDGRLRGTPGGDGIEFEYRFENPEAPAAELLLSTDLRDAADDTSEYESLRGAAVGIPLDLR